MARQKRWVHHVAEADRIRRDIRGSLFDIATHLVACYHDPQWRLDNNIDGDDAANTWLTAHVELCEFLDLKDLLLTFPTRAEWEGQTYGQMRAKCKEKLRAEYARKRSESEAVQFNARKFNPLDCEPAEYLHQHHVSTKVLDVAVKQRDIQSKRVDELEEEVARLKQRVAELELENVQLRRQLHNAAPNGGRRLVAAGAV